MFHTPGIHVPHHPHRVSGATASPTANAVPNPSANEPHLYRPPLNSTSVPRLQGKRPRGPRKRGLAPASPWSIRPNWRCDSDAATPASRRIATNARTLHSGSNPSPSRQNIPAAQNTHHRKIRKFARSATAVHATFKKNHRPQGVDQPIFPSPELPPAESAQVRNRERNPYTMAGSQEEKPAAHCLATSRSALVTNKESSE